jgi:hypothetical protein
LDAIRNTRTTTTPLEKSKNLSTSGANNFLFCATSLNGNLMQQECHDMERNNNLPNNNSNERRRMEPDQQQSSSSSFASPLPDEEQRNNQHANEDASKLDKQSIRNTDDAKFSHNYYDNGVMMNHDDAEKKRKNELLVKMLPKETGHIVSYFENDMILTYHGSYERPRLHNEDGYAMSIEIVDYTGGNVLKEQVCRKQVSPPRSQHDAKQQEKSSSQATP